MTAKELQNIDMLRRRVKALGLKPSDIGIDGHFYILERAIRNGLPNHALFQSLEVGIEQLEVALDSDPFLEPSAGSELFSGDCHVVDSVDGSQIRLTFK